MDSKKLLFLALFSSVTFASADLPLTAQGIYFNEECVPTPSCPTDKAYHPEIFVFPVAITNTENNPLTGFSAYAVGNSANVPGLANEIKACDTKQIKQCIDRDGNAMPVDGTTYWRVCLHLNNQHAGDNNAPGSLAVLTQCKI